MAKQTRAVVASATKLIGRKTRSLVPQSPSKLWDYYDTLGEVHYALNYRANAISRIDPVLLDDEDNEVADQSPLDPLRDADGTFAEPLRVASLLWFVVGEHYLVPRADDPSRYEIRSASEVKISAETIEVTEAPNMSTRRLSEAEADMVARVHIRHPRYRLLADPALASVANVCEELIAVANAARALSTSRAASNGILALAQELSFGPVDPSSSDSRLDGFMQELIDAGEAALSDPGTPGARLPLIAQIPAEMIDKASKLIRFHDPADRYPEKAYTDTLLLRLAQGLNVPPEIVTGLGGVNHWNGFVIDDAAWSAHGRPDADALLNAWGSILDLPAGTHLGYRDARVVAPADQSAVAIELFKVGALSLDKLLEVNGFDPSSDAGDGTVIGPGAPPPDGGLAQTASASPQPDGTRIAMLTATTRAKVHLLLEQGVAAGALDEAMMRRVLTDALTEVAGIYGASIGAPDIATLTDSALIVAHGLVETALSLPEADREMPIEAARKVLQVAGGA